MGTRWSLVLTRWSSSRQDAIAIAIAAAAAAAAAAIGHARIKYVCKSQSCMVSKLPIIWKQTVGQGLSRGYGGLLAGGRAVDLVADGDQMEPCFDTLEQQQARRHRHRHRRRRRRC